MVEHLLISLAWFIVLLAGVVLVLAIGLWLAGVVLDWIAAYRLSRWQRANKINLEQYLRKERR